MAKIFSQLISAQLENKASDYSTGTTGRIWFNTGSSLAKIDDGSAVRVFVTLDNSQVLTNKTLTSPTLTTPIIDVPQMTQQSSPSSPVSGKNAIYFKSDEGLYSKSSGGTEVQYATTSSVSPDQSYELSNATIALSVSAGALTIALKGKDGNNPSGSNIVGVGFRNVTVTTGTYLRRTVTGALSMDVTSGATLGFVSAQTGYMYVYLLDNAGTVELAVAGCMFDEGSVKTSTTMSNAADNGNVLYSTTGRTSKPIRLLARVKFSLTTAGTWDEVGDELSLLPFKNLNNLTDWVAFTPTGSWSANTTYTGFWRRVGENLEMDVTLALAGAPTSATLTVNIPFGLTINTSIVTNTNLPDNGQATALDGGASTYGGGVAVASTTALGIYVFDDAAGGIVATLMSATNPISFGNTDYVHFKASVPITGWTTG